MKRQYQPGIGPFGEDKALAMTVAQMQAANSAATEHQQAPLSIPPPDMRPRTGEVAGLAIEVKCARVGEDNSTYEAAAIKKILSPYAGDGNAVSDCVKVAWRGFAGPAAVLIDGFEDLSRPREAQMRVLIRATNM